MLNNWWQEIKENRFIFIVFAIVGASLGAGYMFPEYEVYAGLTLAICVWVLARNSRL